MGKPTFYTAFSNSMQTEEFLPNLSEEATKIADLLTGLVFSDAIYYMKDEIFTADRLISNFSKYGEKFDIFYFSGHAKNGELKLSDNFISNREKMAEVINMSLINLKLGFFNACETFALARAIVQKRIKDPNRTNQLVLISCGCEINAFAAERFATLFFNHVGRPGTYYDAYKNASSLICLLNGNLRFREFYHYDELMNSKEDFDYAFIDIDMIAKNAAGNNAREMTNAEPGGPRVEKQPASIISTDKKTMDVLSANYLKDAVQTIAEADASKADPAQVNVLQNALVATEKLANGDISKGEVRNIWEEAARVVPGIDSKTDFQSLVNIKKGGYEKINQIFGKDSLAPITNLKETIKDSPSEEF